LGVPAAVFARSAAGKSVLLVLAFFGFFKH
jgi:hypothetical protein